MGTERGRIFQRSSRIFVANSWKNAVIVSRGYDARYLDLVRTEARVPRRREIGSESLDESRERRDASVDNREEGNGTRNTGENVGYVAKYRPCVANLV